MKAAAFFHRNLFLLPVLIFSPGNVAVGQSVVELPQYVQDLQMISVHRFALLLFSWIYQAAGERVTFLSSSISNAKASL